MVCIYLFENCLIEGVLPPRWGKEWEGAEAPAKWMKQVDIDIYVFKHRVFRVNLGAFSGQHKKTGPGNKKTVTQHANHSIRLHPAWEDPEAPAKWMKQVDICLFIDLFNFVFVWQLPH